MREAVRAALNNIAARFSNDAPSVDERVLRSRYGAYGAWPVDSELGLVVLAWVLGPGFAIPEFGRAVNAIVPDFASGARAIKLSPTSVEGGSTLVTLGGLLGGPSATGR